MKKIQITNSYDQNKGTGHEECEQAVIEQVISLFGETHEIRGATLDENKEEKYDLVLNGIKINLMFTSNTAKARGYEMFEYTVREIIQQLLSHQGGPRFIRKLDEEDGRKITKILQFWCIIVDNRRGNMVITDLEAQHFAKELIWYFDNNAWINDVYFNRKRDGTPHIYLCTRTGLVYLYDELYNETTEFSQKHRIRPQSLSTFYGEK